MESSAPLVSIVCLAYNHEPYIRQCLDGFVMQKTNFRFEALVHDDASTDGTADIIREYAAKYPDIIKPIYQTENQYQKKVGILKTFLFPRATGKYIAMCEGDDYWTDPLKLQKQVDFLESNPDYVLCTHLYHQFYQESFEYGLILPQGKDGLNTYTINDYISCSNWYTQPLTALFRANTIQNIGAQTYQCFKDATLFFHILTFGKGYLLPEAMGVYRIQCEGIWSSASRQERIASEIKTMKGIYDVHQDKLSAMFIYNFLNNTGYLGLSFFKKNLNLYINVVYALIKTLKLRAVKVIFKSLNFLNR